MSGHKSELLIPTEGDQLTSEEGRAERGKRKARSEKSGTREKKGCSERRKW